MIEFFSTVGVQIGEDIIFESPDTATIFSNPIFILFLTLLSIGTVVVFLLYLARFLIRNGYARSGSFKMKILLVTLPKESAEVEQGGKAEERLDKVREVIGVAEIFFSTIGGLKAETGLSTWFIGRIDHFSFEIVALDGLIKFYVGVPEKFQGFIEQQIHAQYPDAMIEDVADYNIFTPQGEVSATMLKGKKISALPIKTYKKLEADPLNSLANSMSKIPQGSGAAIQYVIRSAKSSWRSKGVSIASKMQQGKKFSEAVKGKSFIWEFIKSAQPKDSKKDETKETYRLSPLEEEMVKSIEEKASKLGLDVNVRVVASAKTKVEADSILQSIVGSYAQYNLPQYGNVLGKSSPGLKKIIHDFVYRNFDEKKNTVFNTEEFASLFHFPTPWTETPNILWLGGRRAPAPLNVPETGTRLGVNVYRGKETIINIKREDRRRHIYIIGKSGVGKSVFMGNLAAQDIKNGAGLCVIDPHGDLVDDVLSMVPKERADDVIIFDPADLERPLGLNLLEFDPRYPEQKTFVINEMIKIFDKLYDLKATGGPMFEQYMRNAILLIMEDEESGSTLMEISKVLADPEYRRNKLSKCKTQVVKDFWIKEAEKAGGEASLQNMVPYITSKLNTFISNDFMRPIIGQQKSAFNFRDVMDNQKILLVRLSKGRLGDLNTNLLGMVVVGKILMAALSRTDSSKEERKDFYLYIDEFQNFTTDSIAIILSEARKYMLNLIIAHQYMGQLVKNNDTTIRDAVLGNAGTFVTFRIGVEDAEILEKEFKPVFNAYDLMNPDALTAYVKLLIDNTASKPFNMKCYPPVKGDFKLAEAIKQLSRLKYGKPRELIEAEILERARASGPAPLPPLGTENRF